MSPPQKKKHKLNDVIEVLANAKVVITLQYINVSNKHVHYKLSQCYMSIISKFFFEK